MPRIVHGTLVAAAVSTVVLDADYDNVEVLNRGVDTLFFRADGSAAAVAGADSYAVPGGQFAQVAIPGVAAATAVSLVSAGAPPYSVTGVV